MDQVSDAEPKQGRSDKAKVRACYLVSGHCDSLLPTASTASNILNETEPRGLQRLPTRRW